MFVLDFTEVPLVDSTAAKTLEGFAQRLHRSGTKIYFAGTRKSVRRTLLVAGLRKPLIYYSSTVEDAVAQGRRDHASVAPPDTREPSAER